MSDSIVGSRHSIDTWAALPNMTPEDILDQISYLRANVHGIGGDAATLYSRSDVGDNLGYREKPDYKGAIARIARAVVLGWATYPEEKTLRDIMLYIKGFVGSRMSFEEMKKIDPEVWKVGFRTAAVEEGMLVKEFPIEPKEMKGNYKVEQKNNALIARWEEVLKLAIFQQVDEVLKEWALEDIEKMKVQLAKKEAMLAKDARRRKNDNEDPSITDTDIPNAPGSEVYSNINPSLYTIPGPNDQSINSKEEFVVPALGEISKDHGAVPLRGNGGVGREMPDFYTGTAMADEYPGTEAGDREMGSMELGSEAAGTGRETEGTGVNFNGDTEMNGTMVEGTTGDATMGGTEQGTDLTHGQAPTSMKELVVSYQPSRRSRVPYVIRRRIPFNRCLHSIEKSASADSTREELQPSAESDYVDVSIAECD